MEIDWVRSALPRNRKRVIEIGCGIGALFDVLRPAQIIGLDHSVEGLTHTRDRHADVALACADASSLPFGNQAVDVVVLQHVVEHLHQTESACCEWYRVLRPGGVLLLLTPNAAFCDPTVFDDDTHVTIFDRISIVQLVRDSGFEVTDVRTLGLPWFRSYQRIPSGWRLRRFVTEQAGTLSRFRAWRWRGQTLCCAARRPNV